METANEPQPAEDSTPIFSKDRWRSCFFRMAFMWLVSGVLFIFVMLFVKSKVHRDPAVVQARANQYVQVELPTGFKPYSANSFWGANVISYWNMNQMLDDDRSSSVFALYWEDDWSNLSAEALEKQQLPNLDQRLDRNQFRVKKKELREFVDQGVPIRINVFYGVTQIGTTFDEVVSCYRFMDGPFGPLQVHTLGLADTFTAEAQVELLRSVRAAHPAHPNP